MLKCCCGNNKAYLFVYQKNKRRSWQTPCFHHPTDHTFQTQCINNLHDLLPIGQNRNLQQSHVMHPLRDRFRSNFQNRLNDRPEAILSSKINIA